MKRIIISVCVGLVLASASLDATAALQKTGQGEVVGAVWKFEVKESGKKSAKVIQKGRFRATLDGRLYTSKGSQVGTYEYTTPAQDRATLKVTAGKLKGTFEIVQKGINSPTWQGTWKGENGRTGHMFIEMIRD